jgi:hypothetical protein
MKIKLNSYYFIFHPSAFILRFCVMSNHSRRRVERGEASSVASSTVLFRTQSLKVEVARVNTETAPVLTRRQTTTKAPRSF